MTKRLLIDASHAEETRVVVLDGNRLEDFDVETLSRRQLKGNIYLAKVVRVEPSLQAAFVEYGGNRHGFLAFGEIHPDYYQIPIADRQRLIAMQEEEARAQEQEEEAEFAEAQPAFLHGRGISDEATGQPDEQQDDQATQPLLIAGDAIRSDPDDAEGFDQQGERLSLPADTPAGDDAVADEPLQEATSPPDAELGVDSAPEAAEPADESSPTAEHLAEQMAEQVAEHTALSAEQDSVAAGPHDDHSSLFAETDARQPETVGGEPEGTDETRTPRQSSRFMRSYKIQEVIRRRQILLIQVVKEERGTKGAALTTYISLAGRYCVLMPNSPRGGGISRKITSMADRRRLKEVTTELDIPRGMGLIVRTAGAARPKPEIKRDGEYLLRLWDDIRETTMRSMAPSLIHEEASLIKRAIRDVYSRDVDELLVDGEDGWRAARDYMRMLMPTHVKKVQLWPSGAQPLFAHNQVESMLDSMLSPTVQLRSGGYLVINQAEALVAIDVNSGRSTRERGIEETALRTNLEAADEAARQLRLRDLAGLIVIDFIDMESKKHNAMVERRMADALKNDRARIQVGHISHFGLLELSRQRLRPSLAETSLNVCVACGGSGHVRSTESAALHVLREIEEEGGRRRAAEILVHVAGDTALYILNNKRQRLTEIELRYGLRVNFAADNTLLAAQTRIEKLRAALPQDLPALPAPQAQPMPEDDASEADVGDDEEDVVMPQNRVEAGASERAAPAGDYTTDADHVPGETADEGEQRRRRRRRRRRGGRREEGATAAAEGFAPSQGDAEQPEIPHLDGPYAAAPPDAGGEVQAPASEPTIPGLSEAASESGAASGEETKAKRGRRGGRRRRKPGEDGEQAASFAPEPAASELAAPEADFPAPTFPAYVGPTPADPFALSGLDIFDALEEAEMRPGNRVVAEAPQPPPEADAPEPLDMPKVALPEEPSPMPLVAAIPEAAPPAEPPPPGTSEPIAGPAIQPVLIGAGEAASAAPKKGWWRR